MGCYFIFVRGYWFPSQIPLFGIVSSDSADPFYWIRVILASNRGKHEFIKMFSTMLLHADFTNSVIIIGIIINCLHKSELIISFSFYINK